MAKLLSERKFVRGNKILNFGNYEIFLDMEDDYVFNFVISKEGRGVMYRSSFNLNIPKESIIDKELKEIFDSNNVDRFERLKDYLYSKSIPEINDIPYDENFNLVSYICS